MSTSSVQGRWRRYLYGVRLLGRAFPGRVRAETLQNAFQQRQHMRHPLRANDPVPQRLELLPAAGVGDMPQALGPAIPGPGAADDRTPAVELAVCAPVARLQRLGRHLRRAEDRAP